MKLGLPVAECVEGSFCIFLGESYDQNDASWGVNSRPFGSF